MISDSWKEHAYPLKAITIQIQGTRRSELSSMIAQLDEIKLKLLSGLTQGREHDDDFGYRFDVQSNQTTSVFGDAPAGSSFS
jgi:hypothetical protein